MGNCRTTLEKSLEVHYKTKHAITVRPSNCSLGHLAHRNENYIHAKTCLCMSIVALFVMPEPGSNPDVL